MARVTYRLYREGVLREEPFQPERLGELLAEDSARVWVDVEEPTDEELGRIQRWFSLHPLAIEDSRHWGQRPKVEVFPDHLFVVVHALSLDEGGELVDQEVHLFVGKGFLVTLRAAPPFDLSRVLERWDAQPELTRHGAGFLLYALLDEIVDGYLGLVERYEDLADEIEDRVFADEPDPAVQADIFRMKRRVVELRRLVVPLREVIDFVQEQPGLVPAELGPYFRDVADHVIRTIEFLDNIRAPHDGPRGPDLAGLEPAEPGDEEPHLVGGHHPRPHPDRGDLRDELPPHAGARLAARLPVRPRAHAGGGRPVRRLQAEGLALAVCRALKVLCVAEGRERLAELKRATVSAAWELAPGAASEEEALAQLDEARPHVVVAFGPFPRLAAEAWARGVRVVADRELPGAAVARSLEEVRGLVLGTRPGGPVRRGAAPERGP